jgi:1-deoxy-D-xylulose-5-phosphate synthase
MFDVGIAEQHAVTFASGLAAGGLKPFCAIYSTFLQRGYDQLVHDAALQNLPVRFIVDRAGLVGADGPTHGGTFDLSYLCCIPNLVICSPSDGTELTHMIHTLAKIDDRPSVVRFPRGSATGTDLPEEPMYLTPGVGRVVREGKDGALAIVSLGGRLQECLQAAKELESKHGISATVADARWAKPLDTKLLQDLASSHRAMLTIEENAVGGFAALVQQELHESGILDRQSCLLRSMFLPDRFIGHGTPQQMYDDAGLNAEQIVNKALSIV